MVTRRRFLQAIGASSVLLSGTGAAATDGTAGTIDHPRRTSSVAAVDDRIDVFVTGGQSNAKGIGDADKSPNPPSGTAYEFENDTGTIVELDDPVGGTDKYEAYTGSAWPAFAKQYYSKTGQKTAYVPTAVGGSAQVAGVRKNNHWDAGGARRGAAVDIFGRAMNALRNEGFQPRVRGMLWSQGESDAQSIDSGDITVGEYKQAFSEMLAYFRNNIRDYFPFWIFQTGKPSTGDTEGFEKIRAAQAEFPTIERDVQMVSTIQKNFPDNGMIAPHQISAEEATVLSHVYHYSQEGYNLMGETGAKTVTDNVLSIEGTGSRTEYIVAVSDTIEESTANGGSFNSGDEISGSTATGAVGGGTDSYVFSGSIESLGLDGDAPVYLNGERLDPGTYPDNVLSIEGTGSRTDYEITVSGSIEESTANGGSFNSGDEISGSTATGAVGGGTDSYVFSGSIESRAVDGDAPVYLNGERLDS